MIIGIDHGYYAIKTRNCSFPAGITMMWKKPKMTVRKMR